MAKKVEDENIYFKLEGTTRIKPQAFTGREVAALIINLEDSLRSVAKSQDAVLHDDNLYISLVEVVHESAGYRFAPSIRQVATSFAILAASVQSKNYENLPPKAITGLKEIQKIIARKEDCVGVFISGGEVISKITKNTDISIPTIGKIQGETILYGKIQRVGGVDPKVVLRLHGGQLLSLDVNESVARSVGNRLYTEVGLKGYATWSYHENEIVTFKVESLTDYNDNPIDEAFEQLRGLIGKYWDENQDIEGTLLIDA